MLPSIRKIQDTYSCIFHDKLNADRSTEAYDAQVYFKRCVEAPLPEGILINGIPAEGSFSISSAMGTIWSRKQRSKSEEAVLMPRSAPVTISLSLASPRAAASR